MSGAATDLMGEVADAFIAPWVVPGADESTKWSCQRRSSGANFTSHSRAPSDSFAQGILLPIMKHKHNNRSHKNALSERTAAWRGMSLRGNCAPGMQPPNPRALSTTAPHLRSARVVIVGPAASPAASAPIGIGALAAAGARGRRLQNLPRRELSSFLNFGMTKKAQNDDASHNVAWRTLL